MTESSFELHGERVYECSAEGSPIATGQDAVDLIGAAKSNGAAIAVVPMGRLTPSFFELQTGIAGEMVQKFVNYGLTVAILGDTSQLAAESKSLRDFIYESNRRGSFWFVKDKKELEERLGKNQLA